MNLYISFTIAGWTIEWSLGFARSIGWTLDALGDKEFSGVIGRHDDQGNFHVEGVAYEDPER